MTRPGSELAEPWGRHDLDGEEPLTVRIGPLRLHLRARGDELWTASEPGLGRRHAADKAEEPGETDGVTEWSRWPLADRPESVLLSPALPDRTVVAEPEVPFRLVPGARVRVFVRVPLRVRLRPGSGVGADLHEVPTVLLSDTWSGTVTEGELCYWLGTTARRRVTEEVFAPHLAVCPLVLVNRSEEELPVERLALRAVHLSLYAEAGRLWSDETRVRYRGADEESELRIAGERPPEAASAVKVADPRERPPSGGLRVLGFARLKELAGLGGA